MRRLVTAAVYEGNMRAPRRHFASPFVVTVTSVAATVAAVAGGCGPSEPKCGRGCNPPGSFGPDERFVPDAEPAPTPDAEPPLIPDQDTAPVETPYTVLPDGPQPTQWRLFKHGSTCSVDLMPQCRPGWTCNPPPPVQHPYACPKGIAFDRPLVITQPAESTECTVAVAANECSDFGASCPPPRKVRCPGGSE
jgi:hypothetical protein